MLGNIFIPAHQHFPANSVTAQLQRNFFSLVQGKLAAFQNFQS